MGSKMLTSFQRTKSTQLNIFIWDHFYRFRTIIFLNFFCSCGPACFVTEHGLLGLITMRKIWVPWRRSFLLLETSDHTSTIWEDQSSQLVTFYRLTRRWISLFFVITFYWKTFQHIYVVLMNSATQAIERNMWFSLNPKNQKMNKRSTIRISFLFFYIFH